MPNIEQETLEHLLELEQKLHGHEVRSSKELLSELIADEFVEFGASGNIYKKKDILDRLPTESSSSFADFEVLKTQFLSSDVVLITYKINHAKQGTSLRSSIWKKSVHGWQMVFHQGTLIK